jgi:hypothetical protein
MTASFDELVERLAVVLAPKQIGYCRLPTHPHPRTKLFPIGAPAKLSWPGGGEVEVRSLPSQWNWLWATAGRGDELVANELRHWYETATLSWKGLWKLSEVENWLMSEEERGLALWIACVWSNVELRVYQEGIWNKGGTRVVWAMRGTYGWLSLVKWEESGGTLEQFGMSQLCEMPDLGIVAIAKKVWQLWLNGDQSELVQRLVLNFWPAATPERQMWEIKLRAWENGQESLNEIREACKLANLSFELTEGRSILVSRLKKAVSLWPDQ